MPLPHSADSWSVKIDCPCLVHIYEYRTCYSNLKGTVQRDFRPALNTVALQNRIEIKQNITVLVSQVHLLKINWGLKSGWTVLSIKDKKEGNAPVCRIEPTQSSSWNPVALIRIRVQFKKNCQIVRFFYFPLT